MKKLLWKIRCALALRRLMALSIWQSWGLAGSIIESYGSDIEIWSPEDAAEEERDAWAASM